MIIRATRVIRFAGSNQRDLVLSGLIYIDYIKSNGYKLDLNKLKLEWK